MEGGVGLQQKPKMGRREGVANIIYQNYHLSKLSVDRVEFQNLTSLTPVGHTLELIYLSFRCGRALSTHPTLYKNKKNSAIFSVLKYMYPLITSI